MFSDPDFIVREYYQDDSFELALISSYMKHDELYFINMSLGSRVGRAPNLRRNFQAALIFFLMSDYFGENPCYGPDTSSVTLE